MQTYQINFYGFIQYCDLLQIKKFSSHNKDGSTDGLLENFAVQLVEILVDVPLKYAHQ